MPRSNSNSKKSNRRPPNQTLELLRSWDWRETLRECRARAGELDAELILGWHEIENGDVHAARSHLERVVTDPCFCAWASTGLAAVAMRMKEFEKAHKLLD